MKARKITQAKLIEMITNSSRPGITLPHGAQFKWDLAVLVSDCASEKNRFSRSVGQHVDDTKKKSNFLLAVNQLFDAIRDENYQAALSGSAVTCKVASTFKFEGSNHKLWELKVGKKDRIYFYPATDVQPPGRKTIFLLMAFHKKDETTPAEAADPCIEEIKNILRAKGKIEYCEAKNDEEK